MIWGTKKKTHKVKGRKYITFMVIPNPTKSPKTIKIPKWIRFPIYFAVVAGVLSVLLIMQRFAELEYQVASNNYELLTTQISNEEKTKKITELEMTNNELETTNYSELENLQAMTTDLIGRLAELEEYKETIDTKLNSTEKTTDRQPSEPIKIVEANGMVSLSRQGVEAGSQELSFEEQIENLQEDLKSASSVLSIEMDSYNQIDEKVDEILPYYEAFPSVLPLSNTRVTSPYGWRRNPFGYSRSEFHKGVDLTANYGTAVKATGKGTVSFAGYDSVYGWMVLIDHGYGMLTRYAHNSKLKVSKGDEVERGDIIAYSGNSGRSTGPHLHYEVWENGETQNPLDYLYEGE